MTKQTKRLISGTMILSVSGLFVKLISVLYKWPLTNLVGVDTMGYLNTVYPAYLVLTAVGLIGIPATVSKMVAEEREIGNRRQAHNIFLTALGVSLGLGVMVSIFFLFLPSFAGVFAWESEVRYVLWGLWASPIFIAVSGAIRGYFQGMENMLPTAISQIIENVGKVVLGVGLVFLFLRLQLPDYISISGASIGITVGLFLTMVFLWFQYRRHRDTFISVEERDGAGFQAGLVKKLLWVALPITISSAMVSIMGLIDTTSIYHILTTMGESKESSRIILSSVTTVQTVVNVPLAISAAVSASILPAIAIAKVRKDKKEINDKINIALQLATKMALPSMVGIFVLAEPILKLLYKEPLDAGLLKLYSICMLLMIVSQSISSILQGLSGYYKSLIAVLVGSVVKIAGNYLLLRLGWGGYALIGASILYFAVIAGMNFWFLRREEKVYLDYSPMIVKPLLSAIIMGVAVWGMYPLVTRLVPSYFVGVALSVMMAIPLYGIVLFWVKGFGEEEILLLPGGTKILAYLQKKR